MNSQAKYQYLSFSPVTAIRFKINPRRNDFSSNIFDGFSYTGAALASDIECCHGNYAATPHKLAVLHSQCHGDDQSIRPRHLPEKSPTGPFIIDDLNQSVQGTLDVK